MTFVFSLLAMFNWWHFN